MLDEMTPPSERFKKFPYFWNTKTHLGSFNLQGHLIKHKPLITEECISTDSHKQKYTTMVPNLLTGSGHTRGP